ncbi:MAG: putative porin [Lewinella sp.]
MPDNKSLLTIKAIDQNLGTPTPVKTSGKWLRLLICTALLALTAGLNGQVLDPSRSTRPQQGDPDYDAATDRRAGPQEQREAIVDTFGIFQYKVGNPNSETNWKDSLLDGFQRYELDRKVDFDYATIGQRGSAAYPLRYQPIKRQGTDLGLRQFDLYQVDGEDLSYYRLEHPFTYLSHVRESEQEDSWTIVKFSRNFADGVNLVLDYSRINQQGEQDQYPSQALRNTHVATGLSIRPTGSRYSGFFSFAANTYEQLQNGGIVPISFINNEGNDEVNNLANLEGNLDETRLRYSFRELMATQYLKFGGKRDSLTGTEKRAFTLRHRLRSDQRRYRISSEVISPLDGDTLEFYRRFPSLLVDERGGRNQIEHQILENDFTISTFRRGTSSDKATVQKDVLEAGVTHILHRIQQDGDSTINNLLAHARVGLRPNDKLNLLISGQLNLIGQTGDYRIEGEGILDLGVGGKLELKALNQLYSPDLVQQVYRINGETLWNNRFGKTLELRLEGAYTLPVVKVRAGLAYSLLTNYVFFNESGQPQQADDVNSLLQLTLERDFRFGHWNLTNRVLLQEADQDVFRLPRLYGEHSFYYSGKWFKVLNINLGFDVRYASSFRPYYFNPVVQQFQLQDFENRGFQYQVDPFFSMRVTRFRFFLKYVQANNLIQPERLLYLTAEHPYPDEALRFGVSWRLLD